LIVTIYEKLGNKKMKKTKPFDIIEVLFVFIQHLTWLLSLSKNNI